MGSRTRYLPWLVCAAIAGVGIPAFAYGDSSAPPLTASFTVVDFGFEDPDGNSDVTIAPGGTVSFAYPDGISFHNVSSSPTTAPI